MKFFRSLTSDQALGKLDNLELIVIKLANVASNDDELIKEATLLREEIIQQIKKISSGRYSKQELGKLYDEQKNHVVNWKKKLKSVHSGEMIKLCSSTKTSQQPTDSNEALQIIPKVEPDKNAARQRSSNSVTLESIDEEVEGSASTDVPKMYIAATEASLNKFIEEPIDEIEQKEEAQLLEPFDVEEWLHQVEKKRKNSGIWIDIDKSSDAISENTSTPSSGELTPSKNLQEIGESDSHPYEESVEVCAENVKVHNRKTMESAEIITRQIEEAVEQNNSKSKLDDTENDLKKGTKTDHMAEVDAAKQPVINQVALLDEAQTKSSLNIAAEPSKVVLHSDAMDNIPQIGEAVEQNNSKKKLGATENVIKKGTKTDHTAEVDAAKQSVINQVSPLDEVQAKNNLNRALEPNKVILHSATTAHLPQKQLHDDDDVTKSESITASQEKVQQQSNGNMPKVEISIEKEQASIEQKIESEDVSTCLPVEDIADISEINATLKGVDDQELQDKVCEPVSTERDKATLLDKTEESCESVRSNEKLESKTFREIEDMLTTVINSLRKFAPEIKITDSESRQTEDVSKDVNLNVNIKIRLGDALEKLCGKLLEKKLEDKNTAEIVHSDKIQKCCGKTDTTYNLKEGCVENNMEDSDTGKLNVMVNLQENTSQSCISEIKDINCTSLNHEKTIASLESKHESLSNNNIATSMKDSCAGIDVKEQTTDQLNKLYNSNNLKELGKQNTSDLESEETIDNHSNKEEEVYSEQKCSETKDKSRETTIAVLDKESDCKDIKVDNVGDRPPELKESSGTTDEKSNGIKMDNVRVIDAANVTDDESKSLKPVSSTDTKAAILENEDASKHCYDLSSTVLIEPEEPFSEKEINNEATSGEENVTEVDSHSLQAILLEATSSENEVVDVNRHSEDHSSLIQKAADEVKHEAEELINLSTTYGEENVTEVDSHSLEAIEATSGENEAVGINRHSEGLPAQKATDEVSNETKELVSSTENKTTNGEIKNCERPINQTNAIEVSEKLQEPIANNANSFEDKGTNSRKPILSKVTSVEDVDVNSFFKAILPLTQKNEFEELDEVLSGTGNEPANVEDEAAAMPELVSSKMASNFEDGIEELLRHFNNLLTLILKNTVDVVEEPEDAFLPMVSVDKSKAHLQEPISTTDPVAGDEVVEVFKHSEDQLISQTAMGEALEEPEEVLSSGTNVEVEDVVVDSEDLLPQ